MMHRTQEKSAAAELSEQRRADGPQSVFDAILQQ